MRNWGSSLPYKIKVEAQEGHTFLIGLLDRGECNFENLEPWIRRLLVREK